MFDGRCSSALEHFIAEVTSEVLYSSNLAICIHNKLHGNKIPGVIMSGSKLPAKSIWAVTPPDKDAGFALIDRAELHRARLEVLSKDWYRKVAHPEYECGSVVYDLGKATKKAVKVLPFDEDERKSWLQILSSGFRLKHEAIACRSQETVKTHKAIGEVSLRPIHASCQHPGLPLQKFVAHQIRERLRTHSFLTEDTDAFLKLIGTTTVPRTAVIIGADIKDFFMCGSPGELTLDVSDVVKIILKKFKPSVEILLRCLLQSQRIVAPDCVDMWAVQHGSGMGMLMSGDVSDAAFFSRVETQTIVHQRCRQALGILRYSRYKDDIVFVVDHGYRLAKIKELFNRRSGYYKLEWGEPSRVHNHPDVQIFFGNRWRTTGHLDFVLYQKPSSLFCPLSFSSVHPPGVLKS